MEGTPGMWDRAPLLVITRLRYVANMNRSQSRTLAARTAARGTTPGPARTGKQAKAEHRGGVWGRGVSERLGRLKGELGVRAFAKRVDLSPSLVSSYLNGTRLPEATTLRKLAEGTGVSLDWLLLGWGGDDPLCRNKTRTKGELAADLAVHLAREVAPDVAAEWGPLGPVALKADPERVLALAQRGAAEELRVYLRQRALRDEAAVCGRGRRDVIADVDMAIADLAERGRVDEADAASLRDTLDLALGFSDAPARLPALPAVHPESIRPDERKLHSAVSRRMAAAQRFPIATGASAPPVAPDNGESATRGGRRRGTDARPGSRGQSVGAR